MEFLELDEKPASFRAKEQFLENEEYEIEATNGEGLLERGGLFVHLLSKTKNFLNNSQQENLFITSIFSRLAALPLMGEGLESVQLHNFLFGVASGGNSFAQLLRSISSTVKAMSRKRIWFEFFV